MIQILQQLAHLNTVRESLDIISNAVSSLKDGVNNIDLSSVISKIEESTAEISSKIDSIDITNLAKEETLNLVKDKLDNLDVDVDLTDLAKETTLQEESAEIKNKIDNIDLFSVAKLGENPDATNSAILKAVSNIVDTKNLYSVRFESNDDGPNTYTMVLPVVAGVVGDTIIL